MIEYLINDVNDIILTQFFEFTRLTQNQSVQIGKLDFSKVVSGIPAMGYA